MIRYVLELGLVCLAVLFILVLTGVSVDEVAQFIDRALDAFL
jgi:hypothetical protein